MTRCDCCDLPVESCGRAAEQRQRANQRAERARLLALPGALPAAYPGKCADCGERFDASDPISRSDDGWRCLVCCE